MQRKTILDVLQDYVETIPSKPALRMGTQTLTYKELWEETQSLAEGLKQKGVKKGDSVSMLLPNCFEFCELYLALFQIGAVAVPLNHRYLSREIKYVVSHSKPVMLITHHSMIEPVLDFPNSDDEEIKCIQQYLCIKKNDDQDISGFDSFYMLYQTVETCEQEIIDGNQPALILYTSGSTGPPKGVIHSINTISYLARLMSDSFRLNNTDITLARSRLCYIGGVTHQFLYPLWIGATVQLIWEPTPEKFVTDSLNAGATIWFLLPSDLYDVIEFIEQHPSSIPKSLRMCLSAGDSIPMELFKRFEKLFDFNLMQFYGSSENCLILSQTVTAEYKAGALGEAPKETVVKIVDDDMNELPPESIGEIILKSEATFIGYNDNPEATANAIRDGWFYSGDLGKQDKDGQFWFAGRKKFIIIRRGSNITPGEVENVIAEHPAVNASAVVGAPHKREGEVPVAFIQLHPEFGTTPQELMDFTKSHIALYKVPIHFEIMAEIPKGKTGKFDRQLLIEKAERLIQKNT